jgi:hypothetical protein
VVRWQTSHEAVVGICLGGLFVAVEPLWQVMQRPGATFWCLKGVPAAPAVAGEIGDAGLTFNAGAGEAAVPGWGAAPVAAGAATDGTPEAAIALFVGAYPPEPILALTEVAAVAVVAPAASGVTVTALLVTDPPAVVPVPLSNKVCLPGRPESRIVSVALYAPILFGVKKTSIAQLAPGERTAGNPPQVFVCAKLGASLPPIAML